MTFWHDRPWLQVLLIVWTLRRLLSGFHGFICEKQWHHLRKQFLTDLGGLSFFFFQLWLRTSNDSLVYLKKKQSLLASVCILQLLAAVMSCSTTHCQGVANKFSKIKSQGTLATRIYPTYVSRVWKILISNTRPYISKNRQNTSIATCVNPWESSWQHLTFPTQWLKTQVSHRKSNVQASM